MVAGILAIVMSPIREPPGRDRFAFTALIVMPAQRATSFAVAWLLHLIGNDNGYDRGWLSAAVWGLLCGLILIIAGWSDPIRHLPHPTAGAREL